MNYECQTFLILDSKFLILPFRLLGSNSMEKAHDHFTLRNLDENASRQSDGLTREVFRKTEERNLSMIESIQIYRDMVEGVCSAHKAFLVSEPIDQKGTIAVPDPGVLRRGGSQTDIMLDIPKRIADNGETIMLFNAAKRLISDRDLFAKLARIHASQEGGKTSIDPLTLLPIVLAARKQYDALIKTILSPPQVSIDVAQELKNRRTFARALSAGHQPLFTIAAVLRPKSAAILSEREKIVEAIGSVFPIDDPENQKRARTIAEVIALSMLKMENLREHLLTQSEEDFEIGSSPRGEDPLAFLNDIPPPRKAS